MAVVAAAALAPAVARIKSSPPPVAVPTERPSAAPGNAPALPLRQADACIEPGPDLAPTLVVLPPGRFWMGSPNGETGRVANEGPRHWVTIPRPFALGRCEVTVGQFRRFVEATGYWTQAEQAAQHDNFGGCLVWESKSRQPRDSPNHNWRDPGFPQTEVHPVTCISFLDAEAYLAWLSSRTGAAYRLPTEAEWEYAARADTETSRYWGDDASGSAHCDYANGAGLEARGFLGEDLTYAECRDDFVTTAPVASFRPNAYHLYDMSGNVWEWTADCGRTADYTRTPDDGSAWVSPPPGGWGSYWICGSRVIRGGSWAVSSNRLRSAVRDDQSHGPVTSWTGFRVARDL